VASFCIRLKKRLGAKGWGLGLGLASFTIFYQPLVSGPQSRH
jgi:hypothetical protein